MSKRLGRFAVSFYNFCFIFCLKYENESFEVSKFAIAMNIFRVAVSLGTVYCVIWRPELRKSIFRIDPMETAQFSKFALTSIRVAGILLQVTACFIISANLKRRKGFRNFMNEAIKICLKEKYLKNFIKLSVYHSVEISIFYSFTMVLKCFAMVNQQLIPVLVFILIMYLSSIAFGFICFVKNFENFVVVSLKEIKNDLKDQNNFKHGDETSMLNLSKKHQKLFNLVQQFNETLGFQMTSVICLLNLTIIFSVSRSYRDQD